MDKQVYDLSPEDLRRYPLWYFPMDDTVANEMTVRAAQIGAKTPEGLQAIAACVFLDSADRRFEGYVYLGDARVEYSKPVLWAGNVTVTFWNGMEKPSAKYLAAVSAQIPPASWPIRFRTVSEPAVPTFFGDLEGLYYFDSATDEIVCRRLEKQRGRGGSHPKSRMKNRRRRGDNKEG